MLHCPIQMLLNNYKNANQNLKIPHQNIVLYITFSSLYGVYCTSGGKFFD